MNKDNKPLMDELKEVCNKIVGQWHSADETQTLIFSFTDQLLKEADLVVINKNKKPIQTHYTIGTFPQVESTLETVFYFDIGYNSQKKYVITALTKDRMDVHLHDYYEPTAVKFYYVRKTDNDFAENILSEFSLE